MRGSGSGQYLLSLEDTLQRGHLTCLVGPKHLAHGACGRLTGEAVDVDFLVFVLLAHGVPALLQGPTEVEESRVTRWGSPPPAPVTAPLQTYDPSSQGLDVLILFFILWGTSTREANDTMIVTTY